MRYAEEYVAHTVEVVVSGSRWAARSIYTEAGAVVRK